MNETPDEIKLYILEYLNLKELCIIREVNRETKENSNEIIYSKIMSIEAEDIQRGYNRNSRELNRKKNRSNSWAKNIYNQDERLIILF